MKKQNKITMYRSFVFAGFAAATLLLSGCVTAAPSSSSAMIAVPAATVTSHAGSVGVQVTGGSETSALGASKISNLDFATAISTSIAQSKLFAATVVAGSPADYKLDVQIVKLDQPMFGASFTVNLEATWRLTHVADSKLAWEKSISSSFTATMSDAFVGVTRLRLANEGAARNNIKDAIAQMSTLTLP